MSTVHETVNHEKNEKSEKNEKLLKINTYNHKLEIDYHTVEESKQDDQYRKNMLEAFNMDEYNYDKILSTIKEINNIHGNNKHIKDILNAINNHKQYSFFTHDNLFNGYFLLFSFDYFNLFHTCIRDLINMGDINETNAEALINSINGL